MMEPANGNTYMYRNHSMRYPAFRRSKKDGTRKKLMKNEAKVTFQPWSSNEQ